MMLGVTSCKGDKETGREINNTNKIETLEISNISEEVDNVNLNENLSNFRIKKNPNRHIIGSIDINLFSGSKIRIFE